MTKSKASLKIALTLVLPALVLACISLTPLQAQEAAKAPEQSQPAQDAAKPAEPSEPQHETRPHSSGPGRQLVHESREAAGEEKDEMEEFKHSSSVQMISRLTGLDIQKSYWLSVVINFAVIAGVIIWAGRKYLPGLVRDRTTAIQKAMQEAQKAREEARKKLAEIESRLQALDVEIGKMRTSAETEGAAEEARIKAATEEDARKIVAAAEQEIAAAAKAARRQLTAHAADLAVGIAQKQIHVDTATDQALVNSFGGPEVSGKGRG
jgi:F-type H+-transporting ATPase subunit b